ncbi:MAG TPA: glycosyltransferase family 4 protein [Gemmatimonadaceae bacterium]|nr:glycosyltransferase family 4 protein [Gemmatimonadaceae bacterium]
MMHDAASRAGRVHDAIPSISPDRTLFVAVSFEGPDPSSQAGGLGIRMTGLVDTLASLGYETHIFFFGDPDRPGEERVTDSRLVLHRWGQWISRNCAGGVYDGEAAKVDDMTRALPPYLVDRVLVPAIASGRVPIVLFEEWQTAECAIRVSDALEAYGLRDSAVLVWNANNPYGFEQINWARLAASTMITTVSRYMRGIIRSSGADARVIPNGIPDASFDPVPKSDVARLRGALDARPGTGMLFKMARWEREKGWIQAVEAVAQLRSREPGRYQAPVLIGRGGGPTGQGGGLGAYAATRGLSVTTFDTKGAFLAGVHDAIHGGADIVDLRFGVDHTLARALYAAADGVLANSVSEPFGLVGLEAMAAGGVAFTGGTGEDYAVGGRNAIVLETLDPGEIAARWRELSLAPALSARVRRAARRTARGYAWREIVAILIEALAAQARRQGLLIPQAPLPLPRLAPARRAGAARSLHRARVERAAMQVAVGVGVDVETRDVV